MRPLSIHVRLLLQNFQVPIPLLSLSFSLRERVFRPRTATVGFLSLPFPLTFTIRSLLSRPASAGQSPWTAHGYPEPPDLS